MTLLETPISLAKEIYGYFGRYVNIDMMSAMVSMILVDYMTSHVCPKKHLNLMSMSTVSISAKKQLANEISLNVK